MKALVVILTVFGVCFIAMLIATHNAMPYDPSWDEWEEERKKRTAITANISIGIMIVAKSGNAK